MYKVMLFARRKAGLTHAQFREHYEGWHAPWGGKRFFGGFIKRYVRNYVKQDMAVPVPGQLATSVGQEIFPYDVVTEFWFESEESVAEWQKWKLEQPGGDILTKDEQSFFDLVATIPVFVDEVEEVRDEPAERPRSSPPLAE